MLLLKAKPVADAIKAHLKKEVRQFQESAGRAPKLVVILVGEDPASIIYTSKKTKTAEELGFESETMRLPASTDPSELKRVVERLNADAATDGILIQRPLPKSYDEKEVLLWVNPEKDVDAFHPENLGRLNEGLPGLVSCTPSGVMELLKHYEIEISGRTACVVGRSIIVGKPMAALLLRENATLIQCHSKTADLEKFTKQADILVAAAGKPGLITGKHIKPGAVVVDVGIHRTQEGKLVGDVDFETASKVASAITPVPGGVGPMTITMLLKNTLQAARTRHQNQA